MTTAITNMNEPTTATFTLHVGDRLQADFDDSVTEGRIVAFTRFGPLMDFDGRRGVVLWQGLQVADVCRVALHDDAGQVCFDQTRTKVDIDSGGEVQADAA